jgi:hypothetical protein
LRFGLGVMPLKMPDGAEVLQEKRSDFMWDDREIQATA